MHTFEKNSSYRELNFKDEFINVYESCSDDIFNYCFKNVDHREVAKYLTRAIFTETWGTLTSYNHTAETIKPLLYKIAREQIKSFVMYKHHTTTFSNNLWNLTLAQ